MQTNLNPPSTDKLMRIFYALWPDDATRTHLELLQDRVEGRNIPSQNLHLTLAFLGKQPTSSLPILQDVLAALPPSPILLNLDRFGYFKRKQIVWAGMRNVPDALRVLQGTFIQALKQHKVYADLDCDFHPHITLARDAAPPPDLPFTPFTWQANCVALVHSLPQPDGPVYQVLASRSLEQATDTFQAKAPATSLPSRS